MEACRAGKAARRSDETEQKKRSLEPAARGMKPDREVGASSFVLSSLADVGGGGGCDSGRETTRVETRRTLLIDRFRLIGRRQLHLQ